MKIRSIIPKIILLTGLTAGMAFGMAPVQAPIPTTSQGTAQECWSNMRQAGANFSAGALSLGAALSEIALGASKVGLLTAQHPYAAVALTVPLAVTCAYKIYAARKSTNLLTDAQEKTRVLSAAQIDRAGQLNWHPFIEIGKSPAGIKTQRQAIYAHFATLNTTPDKFKEQMTAAKKSLNTAAENLEGYISASRLEPLKALNGIDTYTQQAFNNIITNTIKTQFKTSIKNPWSYVKNYWYGNEEKFLVEYWKLKYLVICLDTVESVIDAQRNGQS